MQAKCAMLELLNVTIGQQIKSLSLSVNDGQLLTITGSKGSGKTTLLRAVLGLIPIDGGYISIDGELLTPRSAVYFRKYMAYVPQRLTLPKGCNIKELYNWDHLSEDERYILLLENAVKTGKQLLLIDEPLQPLEADTNQYVDKLILEAVQRGTTILAVNERIQKNQVRL